MRYAVAPEFVGHQPPRRASLTLQKFAKEPLGCTAITMWLHQDVDQVPVLIDSTPKILPLTLDRHEDFVQVPSVTQSTVTSLQVGGVLRTELPTPLADRLVGDGDPAFR